MTTTVGKLKKDMEKMLGSLTPEKKAQYAHMEYWRCIDESSNGIDCDARMADLIKTINKFNTPPWNNLDSFNYTSTFNNLKTKELLRQWRRERLWDLQYIDELFDSIIDLAVLEYDHEAKLPLKQRGKNWITNLIRMKEAMEGLCKKKDEIQELIKKIEAAGPLDDLGIKQPVSEQKPV